MTSRGRPTRTTHSRASWVMRAGGKGAGASGQREPVAARPAGGVVHARWVGACMPSKSNSILGSAGVALAAVPTSTAACLSWQHISRTSCACTIPMFFYWVHLSPQGILTLAHLALWGWHLPAPAPRVCQQGWRQRQRAAGPAACAPQSAFFFLGSPFLRRCAQQCMADREARPLAHSSHLCCLLTGAPWGEEHPRHSVY